MKKTTKKVKEVKNEKKEKTLRESLVNIQAHLKVPKGQFNSFGNYKYRSLEDILEAVKPYLEGEELTLTLVDEPIYIEGRFWIKATAILSGKDESIVVSALAREVETKKGMDGSQITGMASSYARKYALNGLFLIDDTKDADDESNAEVDKGDLALLATLRRKIMNTTSTEELNNLRADIKEARIKLNKQQFAELVEEGKRQKTTLEDLEAINLSDLENEQVS